MNMTHVIKKMSCAGCVVVMASLLVLSTACGRAVAEEQNTGAPQPESKWSEAGKDIKGAAESVAEATKETSGAAWNTVKGESSSVWEKTKSGSHELYRSVEGKSQEAWQTTKEGTKGAWEKGKSAIHEATAPNPPATPTAPSPPPVTPRAVQ